MTGPSRILILTHTNAVTLKGYFLARLVSEWKMHGIEVLIHQDLSTWVPADVCLVHVDLSVVPSPYIEFAKGYPSTINLHITDIRKKSYSRNRVTRGDGYEGPIIVKTSLNCAGEPERRTHAQPVLRGIWQKFNRELTHRVPAGLPFQQPSITTKQHYRIFPERRRLPVGWFDREDIVVERFRPERSGENYVLREWYFLGDREVCRCEISPDPIFTYGERCPSLERPPPDIIRQIREELRVDYGKIDYAFDVDGAPVLFDVNKTIGNRNPNSEWGFKAANILAQGLHSLVMRSPERSAPGRA
jgi:hypothetical protein